MNILKPGEAMSHGRIMRIKKEESNLINKQMKEFLKNGGKINKIAQALTKLASIASRPFLVAIHIFKL